MPNCFILARMYLHMDRNMYTSSPRSPTTLMPPLHALQDMLSLHLLTSVPHKSHRDVVLCLRGSLQGFWLATSPAGVFVAASDEGIAASYNVWS